MADSTDYDRTGFSLPPVIVGLSRAQEERSLRIGKQYAVEAPRSAQMVVVDGYKKSADPLVAALIESKTLLPGAVLVLSPFNTGVYADESEAELAFEREKLQLVSQLCQLLGATRVTSDTSTLRVDRQELKISAKLGRKVGPVTPFRTQSQISLDSQEEWQQRLQVDDHYPGGDPDVDAAIGFVRFHNLTDPEVASLVLARAAENSLRERTITITYEGKQDRNLDVAAEVTIPQATAAGTVRRSHSTRHRVSLKLHVKFA